MDAHVDATEVDDDCVLATTEPRGTYVSAATQTDPDNR
jgi:hypothetical protein